MKQILIDFSPFCIKCALINNGKLIELAADFPDKASLAGNIYAAKVSDIVKKQFAFLTIDDGKNGLLHLDDHRQKGIPSLVKGGAVLVQVIRDAISDKGPMLSCELSFSGRHLVLIKNPLGESFVKISQKITCSSLRGELKELLESLCPEGFSIIARTKAADASPETLADEIKALHGNAKDVIEKGKYTKPPALLYGNEEIYTKTLKELLDTDVDRVVINSPAHFNYVKCLASNYANFTDVQLYTGDLTIFEAYSIENQVNRSLHHKIWLNCGGYILIEENQACTYIDVNTGKFSGKKDFIETLHFVNIEAAEEIAAQIRLKNISGIIIVDFINSRSQKTGDELKDAFESALLKDRNPAVITDWSALNVAQLTRKNTRPSLKSVFMDFCPICNGTGHKPNTLFAADKIYKEIIKIYSGGFYDRIEIYAHDDIAKVLKSANIASELNLEINTAPEKPPGSYQIIKSRF
ncbi:MAG: ribonuclease E/G [Defluviitaleaceae bacterium]|nr:ribonuclease E/G [Defluviitaleaceae bacterium]